MKRAVSISIGSSKRNKAVQVELLGEQVSIERIGTDGDMEKAAQLYRELDGKVDACKSWTGGIAVNDFDVLIGENAEQKGRFFDGLIDDVKIYNYALKESDIMALYNEGAKR